MKLVEMEYIAELDGRMVRATYDLVSDEIVVSGIQIMKAGSWEEQTGRALEDFSQWIIQEHGDEMCVG